MTSNPARLVRSWLPALLVLLLVGHAPAEETEIEGAAAALLQTTVTVRIVAPPAAPAPSDAEPATAAGEEQPSPDVASAALPAANNAGGGVTVCSGVSLGEGRILTFGQLPETAVNPETKYRVTLPGGDQAAAELRVLDHYSGLLLLEIAQHDLPGLKLGDSLPKIGGTVLSASAAGIEKPLVSMGVLSGADRTIPGASLPPMVQCDISTTDVSSGAALVDREQKLIGVIAATDATSQHFGWSFAIPYQHIRRVLEARVEGRIVVLVRRRPVVGLTLGPGTREGTVVVERVEPQGPADKAGIRQGETVFEAEGRKIRSAYQAVAIILKRLPGDEMTLIVGATEQQRRAVKVTLAGGEPLVSPPSPSDDGQQYQVGPQVNVNVVGPNRIERRNRQGIEELSVGANSGAQRFDPQRSPGNEVELLRRQLQAYDALVQSLRKEMDDLKKQVDQKPEADKKAPNEAK